MNAINVIHPYKYRGMWVFTDRDAGLNREPFVSGADTVLDIATRNIPCAGRGFTLIFSSNPFPTAQIHLDIKERGEEKLRGNTYHWEEGGLDAWLCPALYRYFDSAPDRIYAEFKQKVTVKRTKRAT